MAVGLLIQVLRPAYQRVDLPFYSLFSIFTVSCYCIGSWSEIHSAETTKTQTFSLDLTYHSAVAFRVYVAAVDECRDVSLVRRDVVGL